MQTYCIRSWALLSSLGLGCCSPTREGSGFQHGAIGRIILNGCIKNVPNVPPTHSCNWSVPPTPPP